tara:strand:+ start:972 stop:1415 length:444 start_codon:yes stop_codon:yes gene_type:complete
MQTALENAIWYYLDNTLSTPRPEFNGHPICPWIDKYRNRIFVKEVKQGVKMPIEYAVSLLKPLNYMAVVLAFPKKPPIGTINKAVDEIINKPEFDHIEILVNNHKLKGTVRGVYTGFARCDLVIIQDREKLKWARLASKTAGYYDIR